MKNILKHTEKLKELDSKHPYTHGLQQASADFSGKGQTITILGFVNQEAKSSNYSP